MRSVSRFAALAMLVLAAIACAAQAAVVSFAGYVPDVREGAAVGGVRRITVVASGSSSGTLTYRGEDAPAVDLPSFRYDSSKVLKFTVPGLGQVFCDLQQRRVGGDRNSCELAFEGSIRPAQTMPLDACGNSETACDELLKPDPLLAVTSAGAVGDFYVRTGASAGNGVRGVRSLQDPRPLWMASADVRDVFSLDQVSGLVTALTAATLAFDDASIDINATVESVLGAETAGFYAKATIADLLAHKTGLPDMPAAVDMRAFTYEGSPDEIAAQRQAFAKLALKMTPAPAGSPQLYSAAGLVVVSAMLEKLTSRAFEDLAWTVTRNRGVRLLSGCPGQSEGKTYEQDTLVTVAAHSTANGFPTAVLPNPHVPCASLPVLAAATGFTGRGEDISALAETLLIDSAKHASGAVLSFLTEKKTPEDTFTQGGLRVDAKKNVILVGGEPTAASSGLWSAAVVVDVANQVIAGRTASIGAVGDILVQSAVMKRDALIADNNAAAAVKAAAGMSAPLRKLVGQMPKGGCDQDAKN